MTEPFWIGTGGPRQFVGLAGRGADPILLIHGGPGASLLPFARTLSRETGLADDFTLAYWEQRGTGKSRGTLSETDLSLNAIVADAAVVAEWLAERFGRLPLVVGHSWGTVVGTLLARNRPDLVAAYVGVGQVVHVRDQEAASTAWARGRAEARGDRSALRTLDRLGLPPHTAAEMLRQRGVLARFGGVWHGHGQAALALSGLRDILTTPEYGPLDLWRQARDPTFSLRALMADKLAVDLVAQAPRLDVPVHVVAGVQDRRAARARRAVGLGAARDARAVGRGAGGTVGSGSSGSSGRRTWPTSRSRGGSRRSSARPRRAGVHRSRVETGCSWARPSPGLRRPSPCPPPLGRGDLTWT